MILPKLKEGTEKAIEKFLAEKLRKVGAKGYVLGVSGGIDSAVVMRLCARAVGKGKILALLMPEENSPEEDLEDSKEMCRREGVKYRVESIRRLDPELESFWNLNTPTDLAEAQRRLER